MSDNFVSAADAAFEAANQEFETTAPLNDIVPSLSTSTKKPARTYSSDAVASTTDEDSEEDQTKDNAKYGE